MPDDKNPPTGGDTGDQAPSANPADLDAVVSKAIERAFDKFEPRLKSLENNAAAGRRITKKQSGQSEPAAQDDGATHSDDLDVEDLLKRPKETLVELLASQNRRLKDLETRDQARESAAEKQATDAAIAKVIADGRYANADLLEAAIRPYIKKGSKPGEWIFDDGKVTKPLSERVKELGSRPEFTPISNAAGTNAERSFEVPKAGGGTRPVTNADFAKMTKAERKAAYDSIEHGRRKQ